MASTPSQGDQAARQAAAIPFRRDGNRLEFCLVTSIGKGRWGFPKGFVDPGETAEESALKEAAEEAGLAGRIEGRPLGSYDYAKWGMLLRVTVFLMRVTGEKATWEEAALRRRRWCGADEAGNLLGRRELRDLLATAIERLSVGQAEE